MRNLSILQLIVVLAAAAAAAVAGVDPRTFGDGRAAGAVTTRIEADALCEIFNPAGFTKEWTGDEIGRVAGALVGLSLPFDRSICAISLSL